MNYSGYETHNKLNLFFDESKERWGKKAQNERKTFLPSSDKTMWY
jgi:hypothetical protein